MSTDSLWCKWAIEDYLADFDTADTEKNGSLTFKEISFALVKAGWIGSFLDTRKLFRVIDADDDKLISREEYKQVFEKFPIVDLKLMKLRQQFALIDTDRSGTLTPDELQTAINKAGMRDEIKKIYSLEKRAGFDNDWTLDYEEFLTFYKENIDKELEEMKAS